MLATILTLALSNPAGFSTPSAAGAVAPTDVTADHPARRMPSDRALRRRAIGLGAASGAFGVAWLAVRGGLMSSDLQTARKLDASPADGNACIESCYVGVGTNLLLSPLLITAAGFAGGSLHAHGRWLARNDRGLGRSARNGRVLVGTGVALMVGAFAGLGVGLGMQRVATSERGATGLRELGWWSATALGSSGAALTGLGHGILRGRRDRKSAASFTTTPMLGAGLIGLSISGRF